MQYCLSICTVVNLNAELLHVDATGPQPVVPFVFVYA